MLQRMRFFSPRPLPLAAVRRFWMLDAGVGAAALCLGRRVPGAVLTGLELQPAYADLARENARRNGIALTVHQGDLREMPAGSAHGILITSSPIRPTTRPAGTPRQTQGEPRRCRLTFP